MIQSRRMDWSHRGLIEGQLKYIVIELLMKIAYINWAKQKRPKLSLKYLVHKIKFVCRVGNLQP